MVGKIEETALYEFKEVNIAKDFPELEQGDKIVDFCTSHGRNKPDKTLFAVVTQSGKLYVRSDELKHGSMSWKLKTADRDHSQSNKGDKASFRIKQLIKDNKNYQKVEKVFANRNIKDLSILLFVTASNDSGEKATFAIGPNSCTSYLDDKAKTAIGDFNLKK